MLLHPTVLAPLVHVRFRRLAAAPLLGALVVALLPGLAAAQAGDPLQTPVCRASLAALQRYEDAARRAGDGGSAANASSSGATSGATSGGHGRTDGRTDGSPDGSPDGSHPGAAQARLLQRQAAFACLGARDDAPRLMQRHVQPAITVPPVTLRNPGEPSAPGRLTVPSQPQRQPLLVVPAVPRPLTVTQCDPTGCWANDGSRLNRIGPNLLGPRGVCTVQAGILNCP